MVFVAIECLFRFLYCFPFSQYHFVHLQYSWFTTFSSVQNSDWTHRCYICMAWWFGIKNINSFILHIYQRVRQALTSVCVGGGDISNVCYYIIHWQLRSNEPMVGVFPNLVYSILTIISTKFVQMGSLGSKARSQWNLMENLRKTSCPECHWGQRLGHKVDLKQNL